jgi:hypothetical protein
MDKVSNKRVSKSGLSRYTFLHYNIHSGTFILTIIKQIQTGILYDSSK